MRSQVETTSGSHDRLLRWTARLLILAGAVLLAWCAAIVGDMMLAQQRARSSLVLPAVAEPRLLAAPPATPAPRAPVVQGAAVAALSIPRIDLSAVVLHGSDAQTLRRGPGHVENTALPGEAGNVVIAGHRDSFFWPLRQIRPGDDVFLDTPEGRFQYRVAWTRIVHPTARHVLAPTGTPTLTLITCYPFWTVGPAPDRFVVRATAITVGGAVPGTAERRTDAPVATRLDDEPGIRRPAGLRPAVDDRSAIRQAVERFRAAYDARRAGHEPDRAEPLVFRTCDIVVDNDDAVTSCSSSNVPDVWTFALERDRGGWALRSVEVK